MGRAFDPVLSGPDLIENFFASENRSVFAAKEYIPVGPLTLSGQTHRDQTEQLRAPKCKTIPGSEGLESLESLRYSGSAV